MSKKEKITTFLAEFGPVPAGIPPQYFGYFSCFNRQQFYEAHDVLEDLWLACRATPADRFYKGLIQLAGAFVHLQKGRLRPAAALFDLARANLGAFAPAYEGLDVRQVLGLIDDWRGALQQSNFEINPLMHRPAPSLALAEA